MKIGIDGSRAFLVERTGIEEYSYQVIAHLRSAIAPSDTVVLYLRHGQKDRIKKLYFDIPQNWELREMWLPRFWTQCRLAWELLMRPVDVLFIPAHTVPWFHPEKTIVTVHGLEYEIYPKAYSWWERIYMRLSIRFSCKWAKKIISVSENTKQDLLNLYHVPEDKIRVIYEGISSLTFPNSNEEAAKPVIDHPYFLFIGRIEERKNVARLVEAFDDLKARYAYPHKLVLAGRPGIGFEQISEKINRSRFKQDIVRLGYVSEEKKVHLLQNADVFVFPTLYEGFGLPVLEAQQIGRPVVTSNVSSLPEIAGEGALFVDPNSPQDIAQKIHKLLSDDELKRDIIQKGHENLERFSWKKCSEEICSVFRSV